MKRAPEDRDRFIKFYPSDWRGDDELRACSLAARGLWIELMNLAFKYGGVVLIAGEIPTEVEIAKQVGGTRAEVAKLIAELERRGVASRLPSGALYSRRMVRDAKRRAINKANGEKGGNPSLFDDSVDGSVGDSDNRISNPQRPESRTQSPEPRNPEQEPGGAEALRVLWNERIPEQLPACLELTPKRATMAAARLRARPLAEWAGIIDRIIRSTFCLGLNDRGWVANFDWLLRPDTAVKVLEGQYDNRQPATSGNANGAAKPLHSPADIQRLARALGPGSWASECAHLHDGRCGGPKAHEEEMAAVAV